MSTHRGRKPSGKPGAKHLTALQAAHGKGDFKAAKTHALNYAKEAHSHREPDEDDAPFHGMPAAMEKAEQPAAPDRRAQLARLARTVSSRNKQS